jgi:hypothetical protein
MYEDDIGANKLKAGIYRPEEVNELKNLYSFKLKSCNVSIGLSLLTFEVFEELFRTFLKIRSESGF